ncbi:MAG: HD domain-containing protein, partial [Deltaproteobacteria bacterium]
DLLAYRSRNYSYISQTGGREVHTTLVPIKNGPVCYRCHGSKAEVLGVLSVHLALDAMTALQEKGKQATFLSSLAMMGAMIIALGIFVLFYVDRPLRRLTEAMRRVEDGDFEAAHLQETSSREMAYLSDKFNLMVDRLRQLIERTVAQEREVAVAQEKLAHHEEIRTMNKTLEDRLKEIEHLNITLEERIEEIEEANYKIADLASELEERNTTLQVAVNRLQTLHRLGLDINAIMDLERLFTLLVHETVNTLKARIGYILLLDEDSWTLTIGAAEGIPDHIDRGTRIPIKPGGVSQWVIRNRQPLLIENIEEAREFSRVSRLGFSRETVICAPLNCGDDIIGTMTIANRRDGQAFNQEDLELLATIAAQASVAIRNARLYEEQEKTYLSTVQALVSAVEASDAYTRGHSERVKRYALRLAEFLNLPSDTLRRIEQAAILHDIGKIGICESLLHKTEKLNQSDIHTLRQHPIIGVRILEPIRFLEQVRGIILQHHERFDGKGYPNGISGNDMLLEAKILAVADTYDAMTTDRPYRKALSHEVAIAEIREHAGTQFDPDIAQAFLAMMAGNESADEAAAS